MPIISQTNRKPGTGAIKLLSNGYQNWSLKVFGGNLHENATSCPVFQVLTMKSRRKQHEL